MNRYQVVSSGRRLAVARRLRNRWEVVGSSIAIAEAGLQGSLRALCNARRGATAATRFRWKLTLSTCAALALLAILPKAQAAVVLESQFRAVSVNTGELFDDLNENSPPFTSEFNASLGGVAQQMTVVDVIPESGVLAGASGSGSIVDTEIPAGSVFRIFFAVSDNPVSVSLQTETTRTSPGVATVVFVQRDPPAILLRQPDTPNFSGTLSGTFEGELDMGRYELTITAVGVGMEAGLQSWEFDLVFGSRWLNPENGTFSDGTKWTGGRPPMEPDTALFDRSGTYTVQFDGNVTNKAMQVKGEGVDVIFDLNGFEYHADELNVRDGAAVTFDGADGGPVLTSAAVGAAAASDEPPIEPLVLVPIASVIGARGTVKVPAKSSRYLIDVGGTLHVTSPVGKVEIDELLTVARNGSGTLRVSDGGTLNSVEGVLGENAGSSGAATVQGSESFWAVDGTLFVGLRGRGELNIRDDAKAGIGLIKVGDSASGFGTVNVQGSESELTAIRLELGNLGKAILNVTDAAEVIVDEFLIQGINFPNEDTDGANVRDFGEIHVKNQLTIGNRGRMIVGNNGFLESESFDSGENAGTVIVPTGKLIIRSGGEFHEHHSLEVNGELQISRTARGALLGEGATRRTGFLTVANGGVLSGNGIIRSEGTSDLGGGVFLFTGQVMPGTSPGALTIEGNYEQTGGLLGIEIAGTAPGQFDVLKVTGNVNLGGDLLLEFIDSFAPRQGDEFMFLDVDGALSGAFANVQVQGLLPGFQFDLRPEAGGLTMVALNDGVFVPEPATLVMLVAGMLGISFRHRRSRRG